MSGTKPFFEALREVCSLAWRRKLLSGFNGNVSARKGHTCCITRAGAAKGFLRPEDLALVDVERGTLLEGPPPSSELAVHLEIYARRPEALAVVHCHPRHLLALELRRGLEDFLALPFFEADMLRARLGFAPALPPGTRELAQAVGQAAAAHDAVWMSRHGLVCHGPDLLTALALAEELEHLAAIGMSLETAS